MDPFTAALEGMATHFEGATQAIEPDEATIKRWRQLFHLIDPHSVIVGHRKALDRPTVSDDHWDLVLADKEAEGHDRESYEYSLTLKAKHQRSGTSAKPAATGRSHYLLQLLPSCPPIASPEAVQTSTGLTSTPAVEEDTEKGIVFVRLDGETKAEIESTLAEQYPAVRPLIVRLTLPAPKDLHPASLYPTLGIDSTLPQYRLTETTCVIQQEDYPTWFFFYGTLGEEDVLRRVLGTEAIIRHEPASVRNAEVTTWGGKYIGLIDGRGEARGCAYLVKDKSDEYKLRHYETDHYEVVRCEMEMGDGGVRRGLTFRYLGGA